MPTDNQPAKSYIEALHNEREVKRRAQSGWHSIDYAAYGIERPRAGVVERCLEAAAKSRHEFMPRDWRCGIEGCVACDCLREKFGGSGDVRRATDTNPGGAASGSLDRGCSAAPTPPQPLPSASTKPHGKDVDTADVEEFEPVGTMPVVGDRVEGGPRGTIGTVTNVMLGAVGEGNVEIDNGKANRFLDRFTGEDACRMGILRILKRPTPPRDLARWST